jgi:hypothetical protein
MVFRHGREYMIEWLSSGFIPVLFTVKVQLKMVFPKQIFVRFAQLLLI